jgi:signal peptidase I
VKFKTQVLLFPIVKYIVLLLLIILSAIFFRVFVAEIYYIPSNSMNSTLFEGDIICVSKISYGANLPQSPLGIPILSGLMNFKPINEWLSEKHWNYHRLPGWSKPKRVDIMVFKERQEQNTIIPEQDNVF